MFAGLFCKSDPTSTSFHLTIKEALPPYSITQEIGFLLFYSFFKNRAKQNGCATFKREITRTDVGVRGEGDGITSYEPLEMPSRPVTPCFSLMCMFIYEYIYIYICMYIYIYVNIEMHTYSYINKHTYICIQIYV